MQTKEDKHDCKYMTPHAAYGNAIAECFELDNGQFWVGNGEYESQVNYCPFCGVSAPKKVDPLESWGDECEDRGGDKHGA